MGTIKVGRAGNEDVEINYIDYGSGRPVVLIHGWPLSLRSWEAQVPVLVDAGYRVVAYDRRGFGCSSQPWTGYDYDTFAADLGELLDTLDLRDVTLVGFSMGGGEVVRYISNRNGARVHSAVLAAAVPPYLYKGPDNSGGVLDDATIDSFLEAIRTDRLAFLDDFTSKFFSAGGLMDLVSEPLRLYNREIAAFASPKGTFECVKAFSKTDFRSDLPKIRVPLLVIHGDSDSIVPYESSGKRVHEALPESEVVLIKGGPHGLNVTHAREFNDALLEFLAR